MKDEIEKQRLTEQTIQVMVRTLENAKEKLAQLSSEGKKRIPEGFYENELQGSLAILPPSYTAYIKSLCMDKELTPEKVVKEIDEMIDPLRSGKILDRKARREIASGPWLYALREELERRLNEVSELEKLRDELEKGHEQEMRDVVSLIKKTDALLLKDGTAEKLSAYKERLANLLEKKKKADENEERSRINERLNEVGREIQRFLNISEPYFIEISVIKACSKIKDKSKRTKFLKQLMNYLDSTQAASRLIVKILKVFTPSQIELKNSYNSLLKKKSKMTKKEYERELRAMIEKFLNNYPDYKIFFNPEISRLELSIDDVFETRERELNVNERPLEWLENSFIKQILAADPSALIKEIEKEVQLRTALLNMVNSHTWRHEVNEKITELYRSGKISWFELLHFLFKSQVSIKNIEKEALRALQKDEKRELNIPVEMLKLTYYEHADMLGFYLKAMDWPDDRAEHDSEELLGRYEKTMTNSQKRSDFSSISHQAIVMLSSERERRLIENYKTFSDLLKDEKIASANESLKESMDVYVRNMLILFQPIFLYSRDEDFKKAFNLFNNYAKILMQSGQDIPDLEPTTYILLLQCMVSEYHPLSYAVSMFLRRRDQYDKALQILLEITKSNTRYPIDFVISYGKIDTAKLISYEETGRIKNALKEIKKIQLRDGMERFGWRIFKMIQYSGKLPNTESILLEAMEDCRTAEKYINENSADSDYNKLSDTVIFKVLEQVIEIKLAELLNIDKPDESLKYIG